MLALKSFVIIQLKKELYERPKYLELYNQMKHLNSKLPLYEPLSNLSLFLVYAVVCALMTALLQLTLGFVNTSWSAAICIGFAGGTLVLVLVAWWNIRLNIKRMFEIWEAEAQESKPITS